MDKVLIVFLKYPSPGHVKTRLAKNIGAERACLIYQSLAERVIRNILPKNQMTYEVRIFFTPADKANEIKAWLTPFFSVIPEVHTQFISQEGDDLGARMSHAFEQTLQGRHGKKIPEKHRRNHNTAPPLSLFGKRGRDWAKRLTKNHSCENEGKGYSSPRAIIIGTDCPEIDAELLERAFEVLQKKDVVIGPCRDGGYYLIGMARYTPELFTGIDWSTSRVFAQTIERLQEKNLSCGTLKILADIDRIEDLYHWNIDHLGF
ncbi:MAG: glycosyltransferase [Candidatus Brocadia sp.]|uniref:Glycosyltransferase n=1 Tax=Candidatus Brocadia fulgida TaxID=380242 RepID=A0A0M2UT67_9BACT|nr:MAG: putative glycosyltransferase [Candidatus Brocadia fulgida]UJS22383.1 MAG: glycosyltransferase [Candidatus Brocadia sp.]